MASTPEAPVDLYYTLTERNEKNWTVGVAVRTAQVIINNRFPPGFPHLIIDGWMDGFLPVELRLLGDVWMGEPLTIVEVNKLAAFLAHETVRLAYLGDDDDVEAEEG